MNIGEATRLCSNEGCRRPAAPGEQFCESCSIERSLFRREERPGSFRAAAREKRTVEFRGR